MVWVEFEYASHVLKFNFQCEVLITRVETIDFESDQSQRRSSGEAPPVEFCSFLRRGREARRRTCQKGHAWVSCCMLASTAPRTKKAISSCEPSLCHLQAKEPSFVCKVIQLYPFGYKNRNRLIFTHMWYKQTSNHCLNLTQIVQCYIHYLAAYYSQFW